MTTLKDKVAEKLLRFFSSGPTPNPSDPLSINSLEGSAYISRMEGSELKYAPNLYQDSGIIRFPVSGITSENVLSDPINKEIIIDDELGNHVSEIIDDPHLSGPSGDIPLPDKEIPLCVEFRNLSLSGAECDVGECLKYGYNMDIEASVKNDDESEKSYQKNVDSEKKCQNLDVMGYRKANDGSEENDGESANNLQNLGVDVTVKNVNESEVTDQKNVESEYNLRNLVSEVDVNDVDGSEEINGKCSKVIQNLDVEANVSCGIKSEENSQNKLSKINCQDDVTGNRKEDGIEYNGCKSARIIQNFDVEANVKSDYESEGTYPKWDGEWECYRNTPYDFNSQNLDAMGNGNGVESVASDQNLVVNEDYRQLPKTLTCLFYLRSGTCKFGSNCKYSHGNWEFSNTPKEFNTQNLEVTGNENDDGELSETRTCKFYRFGTCKFGSNCKFNHPEPVRFQAVEEKMMDSNKLPYTSGQTECKFFMKTGSCRFGSGCRFNHSTGNSSAHAVLDKNYLGLPIRPGAMDCPYYMRTGSCKYESNCLFNHPNPTAGGNFDSTGTGTLESDCGFTEASPFEMMFSSTPSDHEHNGYEVWEPYKQTVNVSCSFEDSIMPQQAKVNEEFPERPGQQECSYFLRTGDCKYKFTCKFHHPKKRSRKIPQCSFNDQGLPIRPGQSTCPFYERFGICKFGPSCKFSHAPNAARTGYHSSTSLKL